MKENIAIASGHAEESAKGWLQIEQDVYDWEQEIERSPLYYKRLTAEELSYKLGEQGVYSKIQDEMEDSSICLRTIRYYRDFFYSFQVATCIRVVFSTRHSTSSRRRGRVEAPGLADLIEIHLEFPTPTLQLQHLTLIAA